MKIAKIGIGFGHTLTGNGSRTSKAPGYSINESQANRQVGYKLIELLKHGFDVVLANQDRGDVYKDENLLSRIKTINAAGVDTYWEQHFNAYDTTATGTVTLRFPGFHANGIRSQKMAVIMQEELVKALGLKDRGISSRRDLYALRETVMPAIIMEPLFLDNPSDMKKYDPDLIAFTEAKAIYKFYGKDINDYLPKKEEDFEEVELYYRVVTGSYHNRDYAVAQQAKLKEAGFSSFLLPYLP